MSESIPAVDNPKPKRKPSKPRKAKFNIQREAQDITENLFYALKDVALNKAGTIAGMQAIDKLIEIGGNSKPIPKEIHVKWIQIEATPDDKIVESKIAEQNIESVEDASRAS